MPQYVSSTQPHKLLRGEYALHAIANVQLPEGSTVSEPMRYGYAKVRISHVANTTYNENDLVPYQYSTYLYVW